MKTATPGGAEGGGKEKWYAGSSCGTVPAGLRTTSGRSLRSGKCVAQRKASWALVRSDENTRPHTASLMERR